MNHRELGRTGLSVSEIGFGGSRIGGFFAGKDSRQQTLKLLQAALDAGITFYDTADMYSQGESEVLIGTAFRSRRRQVVIATKGGFRLPAQRSLLKRIKPFARPIMRALRLKRSSLPSGISGSLSQEFSPAYLQKAVEASLRRMRTDYIDLYQLHSPGQSFMQSPAFMESLQALEKLKTQGKIRFYGVATELPEDVPFCLSTPGLASIQLGFGLLEATAMAQGSLAQAEARGLGIIARGCYGGGLLKDGISDVELQERTQRWQRVLALREVSTQLRRPLLELALQFCRSAPAVSVTLIGMHQERHLQDALHHLNAARLSTEEFAALRDCKPT